MSPLNKLLIGVLIIVVSACSNRSDVVLNNPTELEVEVLGPNGQPVSNAEVKIYRNLRDWESLTREVDVQYTDQSGVARFTDLQSVNYYFYTSYVNGNNLVSNQFLDLGFGISGSNYNLADLLTENAVTRVSVNAIHEQPLLLSKFEIQEVQLFLEAEGQFVEVRLDTAEVEMLNLVNYDFLIDINNQFGQVVNDYGTEVFRNYSSNDIGEQFWYYPAIPYEFDMDDLLAEIDRYDLLMFEVNPIDFSLYDNAIGSVIINDIAFDVEYTQVYSYRIKEAGRFDYGNDSYVIDLIINWY